MDPSEPLEVSLRNLIAQQASMIEELRAQNSSVLENQKSNIRDEILKELKPLLQAQPEPHSNLEISQRIDKSEKSDRSKRRQRPKSESNMNTQETEDEDGLVVRMDGYTSIKDFERGRIKHSSMSSTSRQNDQQYAQSMNNNNHKKQQQQSKVIDSSPLSNNLSTSMKRNRKLKKKSPSMRNNENENDRKLQQTMAVSSNRQTGKAAQEQQDEVTQRRNGDKEEEEEDDEGQGSDSDDEGKYGYKNSLWLQRSRNLLDAVTADDKTVKKLFNEKGKSYKDFIKTAEEQIEEQEAEEELLKPNLGNSGGGGGGSRGGHSDIMNNEFMETRAVSQQQQNSNQNKQLGGRSQSLSFQQQQNMNGKTIDRNEERNNEEEEEEEDDEDAKNMTNSTRYAPAPTKAGELVWENEIARNILNLYASKVKIEDGIEQTMKKRFEQQQDKADKYTQDGKLIALQPLSARLTPRNESRNEGQSQSQTQPYASGAITKGIENNTTSNGDSGGGGGGGAGTNSDVLLKTSTDKKSLHNKTLKKKTASSSSSPNPTTNNNNTKNNKKVVVTAPRSTASIWFTGSGSVSAEWTALQPGEEGQTLQARLDAMEERKEYSKYIATVESFLEAKLRASLPNDLIQRLWRQLVVTINAFANRCVDQKSFAMALDLLSRATRLCGNSEVFAKKDQIEMNAFLNDTYAFYYMKRGKYEAALSYAEKSMKIHCKLKDWGHVAKCHLHSASILAKLNRKDEAVRCNAQVLAMVENGKLEVGGTAPQRLCLVAVCYHNIAVEQLHMRLVSEACISAQNARRLARLCLSYSTRFLKNFENTHQVALEELSGLAADKNNKEAARMFKKLLKQL